MKVISSENNPSLVNIAALILRVFAGASMLSHGYPKLEKLMSNADIQFMDFLGLGPIITLVLVVFAEVICSVLIILGLLTRVASLILIVTMLVAIFVAHGADPYAVKEMAVLYFVMFIVILLIGPGKFSIDELFTKKEIRY